MNEQDIMANVIPLTESDVARILETWKADIEDGEQN